MAQERKEEHRPMSEEEQEEYAQKLLMEFRDPATLIERKMAIEEELAGMAHEWERESED